MNKEYEFTDKIMGTDLSISIVCNRQKIAEEISENILKELQEYESKFSRFIPHSELSNLNREKKLKVSDEFIEVVSKAKEMFHQTKGFFNPLVQIYNHGYNDSFELLDKSKDREFEMKKQNIDFDSTIIDSKNNIVVLGKDQKIDFGGILKGFLAEKIAHKYFNPEGGVVGIIINIGGDIYTMGKDQDDNVFNFSIYNPITHEEDITVPLFNSGLATSGTYKRKWLKNGKEFSHILDISGEKNPETDYVSATVINKSGIKSDSYTKLFLSNTPEQALKIVEDKTKYIIIDKKGEMITNIK